jgi:cell division protein FtsZ
VEFFIKSLEEQREQKHDFLEDSRLDAAKPSFSFSAASEKQVLSSMDDELRSLLAEHRARIKVVGCGGGGNNTINRIAEVGVAGAQTIAINTDAQDLLYTTSDIKILLGREVTRGLGAGSNPKLGEEAAREAENELRRSMEDSDMVFITCGLGGGTGTGSAPIVAEIAKKNEYSGCCNSYYAIRHGREEKI